jgi:transcriptional regulator with XRE-family HTH domain
LSAVAPIVKGARIKPPKSRAHKELFVTNLRLAMKRRGWDGRGAAKRLATALGITRSMASSYLLGKRIPDGWTALALPGVFGVSADFFRKRADAPKKGSGGAAGAGSPPDRPPVPSIGERAAGGLPGSASWGTAQDAAREPTLTLSQDEQIEAATRAFHRALETEELHGPHLVRVLWTFAAELRDMGHRQAALELVLEIARLMGEPPENIRRRIWPSEEGEG